MKTLNAKRIATVAAGAALLGIGAAFAGSITFHNIPIISASGQPLVQIVIGSTAQPIDGVSAGNIAAAIGNLAYASVPVTATVNATQAASVLKVSVTNAGSSGSITNPQVWLNESGSAGVSGAYQFGALIGSVLNGAILLSSPQSTKYLANTAGTQYAFYGGSSTPSIVISPPASPYSTYGIPPGTPPSASTGGGVSFGVFRQSGWDNIMELTNAQLSGLQSNSGTAGENSYLWLTGYVVYDQQTTSGVSAGFQIQGAGGAYQVTFNKPIWWTSSSGSRQLNVGITLLGQNWTIINETPPGVATVGSNNDVNGGSIRIASSVAPLQTIYVGQNITGGGFRVQLTDLGQPNSNGVSPASINIYYNNVLTNTSSIYPQTQSKFNISGKTLYVSVNATFAGLYAYQKWAKIQLYSNVYNLSDSKVFNQTTNPTWYVRLLWTNTTSTTAHNDNALQSIIIVNNSAETMTPGQSFTFINNPARWKVTFVGDQFGSANFDTITAATSQNPSLNYANPGTQTPGNALGITNVTEPAQVLTVTSGIPNAFTYAGQTTSSVTYDLTPYALNDYANTLGLTGVNVVNDIGIYLSYTNDNGASWITGTYPLYVYIYGCATSGSTGCFTSTFNGVAQFNSNAGVVFVPNTVATLFNVTGIKLSEALPGPLTVAVVANNGLGTNTYTLATLTNTAPFVFYSPQVNKVYDQESQAAPGNVVYNQQNGGSTTVFTLAQSATPTTAVSTPGQYFVYTMNEIAVTTNTAALDLIQFGIENTTAGTSAAQQFQINYSVAASTAVSGTPNNAYYVSTQSHGVNAPPGFRTERGSKVSTISPFTDTFSIAKTVDSLQIAVGLANQTISSKSYTLYGPYTVGQATNLANVSIGKVTATATLGPGATYNITGIQNIKATPSVSQATTPVLLTGLSSSAPLVILDSQAAGAPQSNYILVGSGFVNSLSQQLQSAYNVTVTPGGAPIVQAYGTNRILIAGFYGNQTNAGADTFINQLYAQATA